MWVTEIEVGFEAMQSLKENCSVRSSVRLVARRADGDDLPESHRWLQDKARKMVEEEIDITLMREGSPPRYCDLQWVEAVWCDELKVMAVVPALVARCNQPGEERGRHWNSGGAPGTDLETVMAYARSHVDTAGPGWSMVDCSDGNLLRLAEIVKARVGIDGKLKQKRRLGRSDLLSLGLSARIVNALCRGGVTGVEEVLERVNIERCQWKKMYRRLRTPEQRREVYENPLLLPLTFVNGIGAKSVDEVKERLGILGYSKIDVVDDFTGEVRQKFSKVGPGFEEVGR